ncbi:MAG: hypothetical protein NT085_01480 [candidate division SR1 bacterium]|nr:hypothetical protein [candidate division SR1 bacterium]
MGVENMKGSENKEQITAGKEMIDKADKFSLEQKKQTGENIVNESDKLPGSLKRKIFEKLPGNGVSNKLEKMCQEKKDKPVNEYLTYKGYPGPHKDFLT